MYYSTYSIMCTLSAFFLSIYIFSVYAFRSCKNYEIWYEGAEWIQLENGRVDTCVHRNKT